MFNITVALGCNVSEANKRVKKAYNCVYESFESNDIFPSLQKAAYCAGLCARPGKTQEGDCISLLADPEALHKHEVKAKAVTNFWSIERVPQPYTDSFIKGLEMDWFKAFKDSSVQLLIDD